jgi:hypothetical protein
VKSPALDSRARVCFNGGMANNRYEEAGRFRKATAIATVLECQGVTAERAADLNPAAWLVAAKAANVNNPSEQTQQLVVIVLQERERLANTDPFDGLPNQEGQS